MRPTTLPDLRPTEDVVWHAGQHWWLPARRAIVPALFGLVCLVVALGSANLRAGWPAPWPLVATAGLAGLALLALGRLVWIYLDWADDALTVTTERVVWVEKTAFFNERRREIPLHRVQNVAVAVESPLARWLGYGDAVIEATNAPPIAVAALPRPDELRRRVFEVQAWRREQRERGERAAVDAAVRGALGLAAPAALPPAVNGEVIVRLPGGHDLVTAAPEPVEGAVLTWRRHWWLLVAAAGRPALLLLLAGLGAGLTPRLSTLPWLPGETGFLLAVALVGLALVGLGAIVWAALVWREARYVLDGDRLLAVAGAPFGLRREVKETHLARVQDVSYCIPNPLAHLLDFGDVVVETGGETQRFAFDGIARPRAVHAAISRRLADAREAETVGRQRQVRDEALTLLRAYHDLTVKRGGSAPSDEVKR